MSETITGLAPETRHMLRMLQTRIGLLLEGNPSLLQASKDPGRIDPRFDIIIGNCGIKDLAKEAIRLDAAQERPERVSRYLEEGE
jgi:hypothetical protein